ncbi:MAG TPA: hypothetical protein VIS76_16225 [Pseudomonadales bacterium]
MVDSLLGTKKAGPGKSRLGARIARTVVLGSVAVAFGIYWLARSYGVDLEELLDYLKASLAFVLFFALAGALAGLVIWLAGRLRDRDQ